MRPSLSTNAPQRGWLHWEQVGPRQAALRESARLSSPCVDAHHWPRICKRLCQPKPQWRAPPAFLQQVPAAWSSLSSIRRSVSRVRAHPVWQLDQGPFACTSSLRRYPPLNCLGLQCRTSCAAHARSTTHSLRGAGQRVQVLQACAVQVIKQSADLHGGWTQAVTLRTVCRRALHVDTWMSA